MDPSSMLDPQAVTQLVPEVYAPFRPIVADALGFFLAHLSPPRLEAIMREQLALPADAPAASRLVRFMRHCPALHKLGQVIARHRELDPAFRMRLQRLETMEPRTPLDELRQLLQRELSDVIEPLGIELEQEPLAEASVAVVVPFTWSDSGTMRQGVLKVLRPGVEERLREDLDILARLADHLDEQRSAGALQDVRYRETFDDVRELLTHEVCLANEQRRLREARRRCRGRADLVVPEVFDFSTPHVTAMQRIFGRRITDVAPDAATGLRLARTIAGGLLADVIFAADDPAVFHADPHAGNLMMDEAGRVAVLDWSLVGALGRGERRALARLWLAAATADVPGMGRAIEGLSAGACAEALVRRHVESALDELIGPRPPGVGWLLGLLDRLAKAGVRFGSDLVLLRKSYFTLDGVVRDLNGAWPLEWLLALEGLGQFLAEWPLRAWRPPGSRDYGTHVSNLDLLASAWMLPANLLDRGLSMLRRMAVA